MSADTAHPRIYIDARNITDTPSGVGSYALNLIPRVIAQGPTVWQWVIIRHPSRRERLFEPLAPGRVTEAFLDKKIGSPVDFFTGASGIERLFETHGAPSLYHNLFHVTPRGLCGVDEVVTLHDLIWIDHARASQKNLLKAAVWWSYGRTAIPHTLLRARRVICVSDATRRRALQWLSPDAAVTIPHGVDEAFLDYTPSDAASAVLGSLGLAAGEYVVAVGNDKPYKNLTVLLDAFDRARGRLGVDAKLVLVGPCEGLMPEIARRGMQADVVHPGFLVDEDLRAVLAHARLFVFPSLVEGFGLPPLEAMALGVPCAVSDLEPMKSVAGEAALRFGPEDPVMLSKIITRLFTRDDVFEDLRARGIDRARTFRWELCAERTLNVYRDVLDA